MYEYNCILARVVDGDTVDLWVDLGFNIRIRERFRLAKINAPELRTRDLEEKARGQAAAEWLEDIISNHKHLKVVTDKDKKGKFGRWLGTLYVSNHQADVPDKDSWLNLNYHMIDCGHAEYKDYG